MPPPKFENYFTFIVDITIVAKSTIKSDSKINLRKELSYKLRE